MKNIILSYIKVCLVTILVSTLFSCGPDVYFKKALPPHVDAYSVIPDKYCGLYMFESDSTRVIVDSDMIITESIIEYKTTLSKIEESENCKISEQGVHLRGRSECFSFDYVSGDTILVKVSELDTLFAFSEGDVLKFHDNKIFLNFLNAKEEWITMVLKETGNGVFMMYLIMIDNKERVVESITNNYTSRIKGDSTRVFVIDPSEEEFKDVMHLKHLSFYDNLIPLKVELKGK